MTHLLTTNINPNMLTNLQKNISYGRQSVRAAPHLGLRHFGNFEEQRIHQEVFEQKTFDA
jgi:hypothetical protein